MAAADGGEHLPVVRQGVLNGGLQILNEHDGGVHVGLPDGGLSLRRDKAGAGEQCIQLGRETPAVGAKDGVNTVLNQGLGEQLTEQQLAVIPVLDALLRSERGDEKHAARRPQADAVGQLAVAQGVEQQGIG